LNTPRRSLAIKEDRSMRLAVATVLNNSEVRMHGGLPSLVEKYSWFWRLMSSAVR